LKEIIILGGARDYHVMDWYRTIQKILPDRKIIFLTDLIGGEGYDIIITDSDIIEHLFIIDPFLFTKQSKLGSIWRNIVKILVLPLQIKKLQTFALKNPNSVFHAQPMYYMLLCWLSGVEFVGTPQGSEILVRPQKSFLYKYFAKKALIAAKNVTVDSLNMQNQIYRLAGLQALLIQNGVDTSNICKYKSLERNKIASIRGMTSLYRIKEILHARMRSKCTDGINFIYPFEESTYHNEINRMFSSNDSDLGRLNRHDMYTLLSCTYLVITIPESDSSPRSIYESIFLGCSIVTTYNPWIDSVTKCMRERILIVDLADEKWFEKGIEFGKRMKEIPYVISDEALELFDQDKSIKRAIDLLY